MLRCFLFFLLVAFLFLPDRSDAALSPDERRCAEILLGRQLTPSERGMDESLLWRLIQEKDELLADWLEQDSGLQPRENFLKDAGKRFEKAFSKVGLNFTPGQSLGERLLSYRRACVLRRERRLAAFVGRFPNWVYARHYTMGGSHYAYTEALSDAQNERTWISCGSRVCQATYRPGELWQEEDLFTSPEGTFRDVDVSPDGKRVLVSYKASDRGDDFHLYEFERDTLQLRQLTSGLGIADYEGCYLPDGRILFNSTRCMQIVDCWWTEVSNLYRCEADGSKIYRMTFDQVHDNYPTLTEDGRVFYTRWEYNDRSQMFPQPLFQMMTDGTGQQAVYGGNSWFPTTLIHARSVPGTSLVFAIATGHHTSQPGELVRVDPTAGREEARGVWAVEPFRQAKPVRVDMYGQQGRIAAYPYPVTAESVVLSFLPEGWRKGVDRPLLSRARRDPFGLYWTDVHGARELLVSRIGKLPCGRPVPLQARPNLTQRVTSVQSGAKVGRFYIQDVYEGESMKGVPRGKVKTLRVVALHYRPAGIGRNSNWGKGGGGLSCTPPAIGCGTWGVKEVIGDVDVREDGSVAFEAPVRKPLYFMLLDERGRMVQSMRSWTVLQPGESSSCVGCHESRNAAPLAVGKAILASRPIPLRGSTFSGRGFSFQREIQPILDARCVNCHTPAKNPRIPDLTASPVLDRVSKRNWTKSYLNLTHAFLHQSQFWAGQHNHPVLNWINSGSTPTLLPPMKYGSSASELFTKKLDAGHGKGITDAEKRILACWVDLGVPFCGSYEEAAAWDEEDKKRWAFCLKKRMAGKAAE